MAQWLQHCAVEREVNSTARGRMSNFKSWQQHSNGGRMQKHECSAFGAFYLVIIRLFHGPTAHAPCPGRLVAKRFGKVARVAARPHLGEKSPEKKSARTRATANTCAMRHVETPVVARRRCGTKNERRLQFHFKTESSEGFVRTAQGTTYR